MKIRSSVLALLSLLVALATFVPSRPALAADPVVHAVLFYSPTCGHCHKVMTEDLPPLAEKYGERLKVMIIDVTQEAGQTLYQSALQHYNIGPDRIGVPTLIVGSTILVGSQEIPDQFPGIIASGLAAGGIAWPDFPGLAQVVEQADTRQTASEGSSIESANGAPLEAAAPAGAAQRFAQDPLGNSLAVIVLLGMLASVVGVSYVYLNTNRAAPKAWPAWSIPLLALIGLGVAVYLSYIEVTQAEAICGPVGDCNSVQQSPYATLFGVLPIGVLGVLGYLAILVAWLAGYYGPQSWQRPANLAIWGMAWFGVLFSIYLTFLEPFVIGATCIWCITSAIVMTLLLWAATPPVMQPAVKKSRRRAAAS